jgi:hypothetical protein
MQTCLGSATCNPDIRWLAFAVSFVAGSLACHRQRGALTVFAAAIN